MTRVPHWFGPLLGTAALAACGYDRPPLAAIDAGPDGPIIDALEAELSCDNYCRLMADHCTGVNAMYGTTGIDGRSTCLSTCALFARGAPDDTTGNTLGCRIHEAGAAAMDPSNHCRAAGPGGNGVCGFNCEGFCTITLAACSSGAGNDPPYASIDACMSACSSFAPTPPYNASIRSGNNFACRLYYATAAAAATAPAGYCAQTRPMSVDCSGGNPAHFAGGVDERP